MIAAPAAPTAGRVLVGPMLAAVALALAACGPAPSLPPSECVQGDADCDGALDADDCAPADPRVGPDAPERCNGTDDDCDGAVDEDFDADADGVSTCAGDCDDGDPTAAEGLPDLCADGVDNDCNGVVDDGGEDDADGDGICTPADCDDADPAVHPAAAEVCDGDDEDCDGAIDEGFDGDGDGALDGADAGCAATYEAAVDCDDADPAVHPAAAETCDGRDEDCDGAVDAPFPEPDVDGDGFLPCAHGDCDDEDAQVHPLAFEWPNAADDDCDGAVDEGLAGDGDAGQLAPVFTGQLTLAGMGLRMSGAGDFNGDGRSDVAVTAPLYANGKGRVFLLLGPQFALGAAPASVPANATLTGEFDGETLGSGIVLADLDGDGFDDLVVGSPEGAPSATPAGQVRIFWGGAAFVAGLWDLADADVAFVGSHAVERCGTSLGAADLDGDGVDDLAVGCPWYTTTAGIVGRVAVFFGRSRADWASVTGSGQADVFVTGGVNETRLGAWVVGLGDLDADGVEDLGLGSPEFGASTGRVGVLLGRAAPQTFPASLSMDAVDRRWDGLLFDELGAFVAAADVSGDGVPDLLAGAPGWSSDTGRLGVLFGGAPLPPTGDLWDVADRVIAGSAASERVGARADAADLDGDGVPDLLVGAPGWDGPDGGDQGRVGIFLGPLAAGATVFGLPDADVRLLGEAGGDALGTTFACLPDGNGDGAPDAWLAAPYNDAAAPGGGRLYFLPGLP